MKLFDGGRAPNPRRVRIFLAEKGIEVPLVPVDMGALEHRQERGQLAQPAAAAAGARTRRRHDPHRIRRDLPLFRGTASASRRCSGAARSARPRSRCGSGAMELNLFVAVAQAFRHIHPAMKEWEIPQIPEWGEANKPKAVEFLRSSTRELANARIRRRRRLFDRRHHRADRHRFHEAGAHRHARGAAPTCCAGTRRSPAGRALPPDRERLGELERADAARRSAPAASASTRRSAGRCRTSRARCCVPSSQRPHPDRQPGAGHQGAPVRHAVHRRVRRPAARLAGRHQRRVLRPEEYSPSCRWASAFPARMPRAATCRRAANARRPGARR